MDDEAERQRRFREVDEANTAKRAGILGVTYRDMRDDDMKVPLIKDVMDVPEMYRYRMVPLQKGDYTHPTIYGITLSTPESRLREVNQQAERDSESVRYQLISDLSFRNIMRRFDPPKNVVYHNVEIASEGDSSTLQKVSVELEQVRPDDILNYLILQADKLNASDIHLEHEREKVRVRFRIDGTLHPIAILSPEKYRILFSSIASAANLSTASKEAQSGHIVREMGELRRSFKLIDGRGEMVDLSKDPDDHILNMRIETVPTTYGQDAVIRLFNFRQDMLKMDVLGLDDSEMAELKEIVSHPHGMVMVVGPTGSGKSTTLFSILNALNDPTRKLITLEDPVEFDIPGVTQIPVDTTHGQSFADNVRTILRLDPDVVMVGEIRDVDTAKTAIQAAITGHLLLATFHAQDAAAAFARFVDMIGINPVFTTAIRVVIGQRLVRRLDPETRIEYEPDEMTKQWIRKTLADLPPTATKPDLDNIRLWRPGKSASNPFGYKGRTVLMEQLIMSDEIAKFISGEIKDVNANAIAATAKREGMVTMLQKGVMKALAGETTLEEVNRVL